jgi:pimeloyl-ACP methyl ester carboxylesterase
MVALRFALAHPERVLSLVLMDTVARPFRLIPPQMLEPALEFIRSQGMQALAKVLRGGRGLPRPPAAVAAEEAMGSERWWSRIEAKLANMDPAAYEGIGGANHPGVVERLGEIACPTLVMVGEQDAVFLGLADELEAGIPGARRITIPRAAHSPQLENPDAWLTAIREHLVRARS